MLEWQLFLQVLEIEMMTARSTFCFHGSVVQVAGKGIYCPVALISLFPKHLTSSNTSPVKWKQCALSRCVVPSWKLTLRSEYGVCV